MDLVRGRCVMPAERSIDIDTQLDFEMAEFLYRRSSSQIMESG